MKTADDAFINEYTILNNLRIDLKTAEDRIRFLNHYPEGVYDSGVTFTQPLNLLK